MIRKLQLENNYKVIYSMSFPKIITKYVKRAFNYLGFELSRKYKLRRGTEKINIAGFPVLINCSNPLYSTYLSLPDYSSELGRLVSTIKMYKKTSYMTVIDIGANVGDTLAIIKSADSNARVHCVEGDKYCFDYLKKNSQQFSNVFLHQLYLGEFSESISVNLEKQGWNTTIIPIKNHVSQIVKLEKLDDFLKKINKFDGQIDLIKIDTEGFDLKILRGGFQYLAKMRPVLYIEYNRLNMSKIGEDGLSSLQKLVSIGYDKVFIYENTGRFMMVVSLKDEFELIEQLHEYIDGSRSSICYFDLCIFHQQDAELSTTFLELERKFRNCKI